MQLREYQTDCIKALWQAFRANPSTRPLLVCPTGSGKSVICAEIIRQIKEVRKDFYILVVTHRKEIVEQNSRKYFELTGDSVGIVSAGLGQKIVRKVTFANIQSVYRDATKWDIIIIDECHLFSGKPESMYGKLLERNSEARVIGLTATPYRMDHGFLVGPNTLFTEVAYEISIEHLIGQGFLAPLISLPAKDQIDTEKLPFRGFDYAQEALEAEAMKKAERHAPDILARTKDRHHVLVFCAGVAHAQAMAAYLGCECVHGSIPDYERDRIIGRFKSGETRYLTNCDVLTTGFDFPAIDCIVLVRPTQSTGLYVQMVGRGSRVDTTKTNCMVLDYGGNIKRHGPIDQIKVSYKEKFAEFSLSPLKACEDCGCVVNISLKICPSCGAAFPINPVDKYTDTAATAPVLSKSGFDVAGVTHRVHFKVGGIPSFRIDFNLEIDETISDFWCFGHTGYAREKACQNWLKFGGKSPAPKDAFEAETRAHELKQPVRIEAKKDGKYWRVTRILEWWKMSDLNDDDPTGLNI